MHTRVRPDGIDSELPGPMKSPETLLRDWKSFLVADPKLRIRDAAERLGVSEVELLSLNCGKTVTRLSPDFAELIRALPSLGAVISLTRNDHAVHEKYGHYGNISFDGATGWVLDEDIKLRVMLDRWQFGFAAAEGEHGGERISLQFFDKYGCAVHKVYLTGTSDQIAYENLIERFVAADQSPVHKVLPPPRRKGECPDSLVDRSGIGEWRALHELDEFFPMVKQRNIEQLQVLCLADRDIARPISNQAMALMLQAVAERALPIMVVVSSPGVTQIHCGPVHNIRRTGPWINVLDQSFNLHLRDSQAYSTWVARDPSIHGVVTSLEVYDAAGELIIQFFGPCKPDTPASVVWRDILNALPAEEQVRKGECS